MRRTVIIAATTLGMLVGFGRPAAAEEGAELFSKKCATCHGKDGKGQTMMGKKLVIKDLTDAALQAKLTDADIEKQILTGTKDKDTGKERMPSFKDKVSGDDIKALIKHVRTFKG